MSADNLWTAEDSRRIDTEIRRLYPSRKPLRHDPALAALIKEFDVHEPSSVPIASTNEITHKGTPVADACNDCERPMWRAARQKPDGYVVHAGRGLCSACHSRSKRVATRTRPIRGHLSDEQVQSIDALTARGVSASLIASILGVSPRTVQRQRAKLWIEKQRAVS